LPVELPGAGKVFDADHDGGHLQSHGFLLLHCVELSNAYDETKRQGVTRTRLADDPVEVGPGVQQVAAPLRESALKDTSMRRLLDFGALARPATDSPSAVAQESMAIVWRAISSHLHGPPQARRAQARLSGRAV